MTSIQLYTCSFVIGALLISIGSCIIIDTSNGQLEGNQKTLNNKDLYSFKRIPFAQPPLGLLRFAKPVKASPWKGILNAKEYGPACPQNSTSSSYHPDWIDEDCLHVNVFTSKQCLTNKNCSVVFYIHGGGMNYDSPVMFDDEYLYKNFASKDVVIVLPAFRLGFLGLLSLSVATNNMAAYDVIHALKWVQNDVQNFGGNRSDVTLLGHSMGAGFILSVSFSKTIDPDRKLFQKAIAMSGDIYLENRSSFDYFTLAFAKETGCLNENATISTLDNEKIATDVLACLRQKDVKEVLRAQRKLEEEGLKLQGLTLGGPLFPAQDLDDFLTDVPSIPLLIGATTREMDRTIKPHEVIPAAFLAQELGYTHVLDIGKKYDSDVIHGRLGFHHSIETQAMFLSILNAATKQAAAGANVYLYMYSNPTHPFHVDYLSYLMGVHTFKPDENEKVLEQLIPELFINFVKDGHPNEEWEKYNPLTRNYYNLDVDVAKGLGPSNKLFFEKDVYNYWTKDVSQFDVLLSKDEHTEQHIENNREVGRKINNIVNPRAAEYVVLDEAACKNIMKNKSATSYVWDVMTYMGFTLLGFVFGTIWASKKYQEDSLRLNEKIPLYNTIMH